jgi:hypothetical protein
MSILTEIAHDAWLEAQPTMKDFRRVASIYASITLLAVVLSVATATLAAAGGYVQSAVVVLLLAAGIHYVARTSVWAPIANWRENSVSKDAPFSFEKTDRAKSIGLLRQSIAGYAGRLFDWDGMEGTAPRPDAIADALTFIDRFPPESVLPDRVYAPGDGEVMFQWLRPATLIEIGFYGDDTISWYARVPGRADVHGDDPFDRHLDRQLPQPLADALHLIATRA